MADTINEFNTTLAKQSRPGTGIRAALMAEAPSLVLPYQRAVSTLGKPQKPWVFLGRSGT